MSVTKHTNADVYSVKNKGEWATIVVREWSDRREDGSDWPRGEILINSTFGSWSQYWNAPGMRFKKFLIGLDFDYVFGRFMGLSLEQFDGDASVAGIQRKVLDMRRRRQVGREEARFVWSEIDERTFELSEGEQSFITACGEIRRECEQPWSPRTLSRIEMDELATIFEEPWYEIQKRDDPQAVGFWRILWPEFCGALRAELEPAKEAA